MTNDASLCSDTQGNDAQIIPHSLTLDPDVFPALSIGAYTVQDIEDMELLILQRLSWRVNPPTIHQVGYQIFNILSFEERRDRL